MKTEILKLTLKIVVLLIVADGAADQICPNVPNKSSECVCETPQGKVDLTPLSQTEGGPR